MTTGGGLSAAIQSGSNPNAKALEAQGMVSVQAHCSMVKALALMEQRALDRYRTFDEVAEMILDGTIRFTV